MNKMKTPQWIKKLGGHAGELYVSSELSKRGICNSLLPENFSDDDLIIGKKNGDKIGFIQVKSCHPDRAESFLLKEKDENWTGANENQFVIFVWLGSPIKNESPRFWITTKKKVGEMCISHSAHGTSNWERRFSIKEKGRDVKENCNYLKDEWENNWKIFNEFLLEQI